MVRYAAGLTEREKIILLLKKKGLSFYKIGRKLKIDVTNTHRTYDNAIRKLAKAQDDLAFAQELGVLSKDAVK